MPLDQERPEAVPRYNCCLLGHVSTLCSVFVRHGVGCISVSDFGNKGLYMLQQRRKKYNFKFAQFFRHQFCILSAEPPCSAVKCSLRQCMQTALCVCEALFILQRFYSAAWEKHSNSVDDYFSAQGGTVFVILHTCFVFSLKHSRRHGVVVVESLPYGEKHG